MTIRRLNLRVIDIVSGTSVDGPGLRTSIYLAGCQHRCPGCHNPESWPMEAGREMTVEEIMQVVRFNQFPVTLSGGDPMYQAEALGELLLAIRSEANQNTSRNTRSALRIDNPNLIWCYTGFTYEALQQIPACVAILPMISVLVDGPFIEAEKPKGPALRFRGSANQRFISPATGMVISPEEL